jgi:oxygen-independent coproporphyrinogen-3 oxidase
LAGIYLHIPFCKQACHYCNFHFSTSLRHKDDMVATIVKEIELRQHEINEPVKTIYFGGGTPSLLSLADCEVIMKALQSHFSIVPDAEITLEANPDDITTIKLEGWKALGVNRLSIGTQSFFEEELIWMNRAHTAAHAKECIELSVAAGITNISIDLIYGSPLLTDAMWQQNVKTAIDYGILHLSCYALTVEEKTPLHKHIATNKKPDVDNEKQARQFMLLMEWLRTAGYEHYEVSNFAKPGFRSQHNSSYWKGDKYLGLGPSAHSYNGVERSWNIANNAVYIKEIQTGIRHTEIEVLTDANRINEQVMIALRTLEGLDLVAIENAWGGKERQRLERGLLKFTATGLVQIIDNKARLTDNGMLRADGIASNLFC